MIARRLRVRLDRLSELASTTRKAWTRERPFEFTIAPALAKTLRDDVERLHRLQHPNGWSPKEGPETDEERALRRRIAEKAMTISCPNYYGFEERWDDWARLGRLRPNGFDDKPDPLLIFPEAKSYYEVEDVDAEQALLTARIAAFDHSPEGRARFRIEELVKKARGWMSAADHSELDQLMTLYPEPWCHPNTWGKACYIASGLSTPEERRRLAEKHQRALEKTNLYRSRAK